MSDQRWDDEPGVSPQGYIIGCTGGCACQCDLPECGCHRTTRDTPEATEAGGRLLAILDYDDHARLWKWERDIAAIETEARRAALASLRECVAGLREDWPLSAVMALNRVLAEIDRRLGPQEASELTEAGHIRADLAEVEIARLRAALEQIADEEVSETLGWDDGDYRIRDRRVARAALAPSEP